MINKKGLLIISICVMLFSCYSKKSVIQKSFSNQQTQLIMTGDSITPMRVFKITNSKDSILLRTKSDDIYPNTNDVVLKRFVNRLLSTVRDSVSLGVGIAAPQVGILKNIIWVQRFDKENFPFEVYLNPVITHYSDQKQRQREGCLSIPNRTDTLNTRSFSIAIAYDTMNAEHKTETIEGFTSVIFQHEIDHLNGILYVDHLKDELVEAKKMKQ